VSVTYLDSSAIVKLVVTEDESETLRRYLRRRRPLVSSALARTEVLRAVLDEGTDYVAAARDVLRGIDLVRLNHRVLDRAGSIPGPGLRTLDAIHLATAESLHDDLAAVVTYDDRLADAARDLGYRVVSP
jgi:predicted nucleic acid-binding protein